MVSVCQRCHLRFFFFNGQLRKCFLAARPQTFSVTWKTSYGFCPPSTSMTIIDQKNSPCRKNYGFEWVQMLFGNSFEEVWVRVPFGLSYPGVDLC